VVAGQERIPLQDGVVRLVASPFERTLVLHVARGDARALARRLSGRSRICPTASAAAGTVTLRCTSERVRADLDLSHAPAALVLIQLTIPPWRPGEEPPPYVPFDTGALGLGACPGETPAVRGECALARGDREAARRHFEEAVAAGFAPLASLRLGDLALGDDDLAGAAAHWRHARGEAPWARLADARLCEVEPRCLDSDQVDAVFDSAAVVFPLRADLVLRRARLRALAGDIVPAAASLVREADRGGACEGARPFCRHLLALALAQPQPAGAEAVAIYLDTPGREDGPDALPLARAAAAQAGAAGAPEWGASLLAALTDQVPEREQGDHLARIVRLFLDAGDRARAGEVVRFAETRLARAQLAGREWAALRRAVRAPAPAAAPEPERNDPDLEAARAAIEAARLARLTKRKGAAR